MIRRPLALRHARLLAALTLAWTAAAQAAPDAQAAPEPPAMQRAPVATEVLPVRRAAGTGLARRPDDRRPDEGIVVELFGQPVRLSGEYEVAHDIRRNLDLNKDRDRDTAELEQELKLEASFSPRTGTTVFLALKAESEIETWRQSGPEESTGELKRDEAWVFFAHPAGLPLDLQVGRIALIESRSWWWDEDLDAIRLFFGNRVWLVETGLAREMLPVSTEDRGIDPEDEDLVRWFGRAAWTWRKDHNLEAYWLLARDGTNRPAVGRLVRERRADPIDGQLDWVGVRATGEEETAGGHRFGYWLDAARLTGREWRTDFDDFDDKRVVVTGNRRQKIDATAWDAGVLWSLPGDARPTVWLGYANGSGDGNDTDGTDHTFRQTGLQENEARFGGVKRFHYYGELFRPELSNLSVASIGFGLRFLKKSSVDLVLHDYRQRHASRRLPVSRLSASATGDDRHLGQEVDLFVAIRESKRLDFTATLAAFRAGPAFGPREGEKAYYFELKMSWDF